MGRLVRGLTVLFPNVPDPHLIDTAVIDAMVNYFNRPEQYDAAALSLYPFLRMAAKGDLLNALRRQKRVVELKHPESEHVLEGLEDPADLEADVIKGDSPL